MFAGAASLYPYGRLYVLNAIHRYQAERRVRLAANRRRASKYAACRRVRSIARVARKHSARSPDRNHARVAFVVACARRDAHHDRKNALSGPDPPRKKNFGRRRIGALERVICAKLRNFRERTNASRAPEADARDGSF
jgi:hypothetical protein